MRYKKYVEAITKSLSEYKVQIDALEKRLAAEQEKFKEQLAGMVGKFTTEYIAEFKKNYKLPTDYKAEMEKQRSIALPVVVQNLEAIEKQLNAFFNAPVRQEFANKINSISTTGLALTDREFRILKESASSYLEIRLLNQLAETRSKQEKAVTVNSQTGMPESQNKEVANPYMGIEIPNIDVIYNAFDSYAMNARRFVKSYSGVEVGLKQFLDDTTTALAATADSYFRNKAAERFSEVMSKAVSILPEYKKKSKLTESDMQLIDALIDPKYPTLAGDTVKIIAEHSPEIGGLLKLDPRYKDFLEEE